MSSVTIKPAVIENIWLGFARHVDFEARRVLDAPGRMAFRLCKVVGGEMRRLDALGSSSARNEDLPPVSVPL